jgi:serine/threonine protein phosphatase PrpC
MASKAAAATREVTRSGNVSVRGAAIRAAGGSHCGRIRLENEDRFHLDAGRGIYLVVDGVGGHQAGEVAAAIASDVIVRRLERPTGTVEQRVREAITLANNEIVRQAAASPAYAGMTCVATVAVIRDDRLTIGHVGDSRLYKLTREGVTKLTHDHSPVGEREDAKEISEQDAMRHPRRNEVFRDVGGALREPDDPEFIEIVETRFESDAAILLCSDGLSDMLATAEIDSIVRQRAGDPSDVVRMLIESANDAGGLDNITAVYVEGPRFAAVTAASSRTPPGEPRDRSRSRSWFGPFWGIGGLLLGLALGMAVALLPVFEIPFLPRRSRLLVVGSAASDDHATIAAALGRARPGDIVQLEPGEYAESLMLPDGVSLSARESGTAVLVAPPGQPGWVGLAVRGEIGSHISGLRVRGRPEAPIAVGVRLAGRNVVVDDVTIEGTIGVGVDVEAEGSPIVRGSRFVEVAGVPVRIGAGAGPVVQQTLFERPAGVDSLAAFEIDAKARPELVGNVLVGYGEALRAPSHDWTPARLEQLFRGNYRIRSAHSAQ